MTTELIGWVSATILLATIGRQVYSQWRERSSQGISSWLFIGQIMASVGFVIYSWLLRNWVVATNVLMLALRFSDNGFTCITNDARGWLDKQRYRPGLMPWSARGISGEVRDRQLYGLPRAGQHSITARAEVCRQNPPLIAPK